MISSIPKGDLALVARDPVFYFENAGGTCTSNGYEQLVRKSATNYLSMWQVGSEDAHVYLSVFLWYVFFR